MGKVIAFQPQQPKGTVKSVHIVIDESCMPIVQEWTYKDGHNMACITASDIKMAAALFSQYANGKGAVIQIDGDAKGEELLEIARQGGGNND